MYRRVGVTRRSVRHGLDMPARSDVADAPAHKTFYKGKMLLQTAITLSAHAQGAKAARQLGDDSFSTHYDFGCYPVHIEIEQMIYRSDRLVHR